MIFLSWANSDGAGCCYEIDLWPLFINPPEYLNCLIHSLQHSKDIDKVILHFKHVFRGIHHKKTVLWLCFSQKMACSIVIVSPQII